MFAPACRGRVAGIAAGYLADALFGDPRRGHPVALFGSGAAALERLTYADSRRAGALHAGALLGALGVLGVAVERAARRRGPGWTAVATAAATFVALGGTSLSRTGHQMAGLLDAGDVAAARRLLPSLCGRDPAALDSAGLARAALESVAENTSDAHVAPVLWAAVGGVPAVLVYRGANTLDAMIGNRSPRYVRFGWAAARFDDAVNFVAARVTALLVAIVRASGGRITRRSATCVAPRRGPSPQPQRGCRGGRLRRSAGRAARRTDAVRTRTGDQADARRRASSRGLGSRSGGAAVANRAGRGGRGLPQRRRPYRSASFCSVVSGAAAASAAAAFSRRRCRISA